MPPRTRKKTETQTECDVPTKPKSRKKKVEAALTATDTATATATNTATDTATDTATATATVTTIVDEHLSIATDEHIILQLPIPADRIQDIVSKIEGENDGRNDPSPYVPSHCWTMSCTSYSGYGIFDDGNGNGNGNENACTQDTPTNCHWCCHAIFANKFGMPVDYDSIHNVFHVYGQFCSLSCAAAYNVTSHMGSDRMWDIHGWIQMMAHVYQLPLPVRPAPSRYVLKMFGGSLSIEEFRAAHNTLARTVVLNVPPLVSVQPQVEWVNTSFLAGSGNGLNTQRLDGNAPVGDGANDNDGKLLARHKSLVDSKRSLESKMNLTVSCV